MVRPALIAICCSFLTIATVPLSAQSRSRPEPYVAPLLPGLQAWIVTLPAPPAAGGAMDDARVYVPLEDVAAVVDGEQIVTPGSAAVVALDRQTGETRWSAPLASTIAPLVAGNQVLIASGDAIQALDAATGVPVWRAGLPGSVRGPMAGRGDLVLALTEPDRLTALDLRTRQVAWSVAVGAGEVLMDADHLAAYLAVPESRVLCVRLADGSIAWERTLTGTLSTPVIARDRLLVGSTTDTLWALDPESGEDEWVFARRIFGGDVLGAAVEGDVAYVVSLDNILRALNRGNGNQRSKRDLPTRPIMPPRVFFGTVVVIGLDPVISTYLAKDLTPVATWVPPPPGDAELQGAPLIDEYLDPFGVAMVVVLRDGRVIGVRPTAMTFPEPPLAPLSFTPGRTLPPERLQVAPEPPSAPLP